MACELPLTSSYSIIQGYSSHHAHVNMFTGTIASHQITIKIEILRTVSYTTKQNFVTLTAITCDVMMERFLFLNGTP